MQEDPLLRKCKSCHANIGSTETYCPFCWEPTGFQSSSSPPQQNANTNEPSQHTQNPIMERLLRFSSISGPGLLLIFGLVCLSVFGLILLTDTGNRSVHQSGNHRVIDMKNDSYPIIPTPMPPPSMNEEKTERRRGLPVEIFQPLFNMVFGYLLIVLFLHWLCEPPRKR